MTTVSLATGRTELARFYRRTLVDDVIPFWVRHGVDPEHGGMLTIVDRDGRLLDSDKSVWFQGRAGWMFATLFNRLEANPVWRDVAVSCAEFSLQHCHSPTGKMWFTVTREGRPLRMRRYVFSEAFAAISYAAVARATGESRFRQAALSTFETYLHYSFSPGVMNPKFEATRPSKGLGPLMIAIVTAQEIRENLGDITVAGQTCSQWIANWIVEIARDFFKPELNALLEMVSPTGDVIEHLDGRTLNPGHAIECAWFMMWEGRLQHNVQWIEWGCAILECMWQRGWDTQYGGLLYFVDLDGHPVQEYWHEMKFWWPHCEAIIASLLAWKLTGEQRFADMHARVHQWSFAHFADAEHGEWYGYLRRDGSLSQPAKGNHYKGPFHLPRMLWICAQELD